MQYPTDHGSLVFIATAVKKSPIVDGLLGFTCDMAGSGRRVQFHPEARWPKWSCSASRLLEVPAEQFLSPQRNGRSLRKQPQGCADNWDLCREKVARPVSRTQLLDSHRESKHPRRSRGAKPNRCEAQGPG